MLYALDDPLAFVTLVVAFVVAVVIHGTAQALVAARLGDRAPAAFGGRRLDPRAHLDPFGAVAAAIGGIGWGKNVTLEVRRLRGKGRFTAAMLAGPVVNIAVGVAAITGFLLLYGPGPGNDFAGLSPSDVVHGDGLGGLPAAQVVVLAFGVALLGIGLLALVPIPPLPGGRLLFAFAPRTIGWQRAEYRLAEQNWGVAILLVLLVLPLAGRNPLLLGLFDVVGSPIFGLIGLLGG